MVKNVDNSNVKSLSKKSPIGYILEVDVEHPDELHVLHKKLTIPYTYCQIIVKDCRRI